MSNTSEVYYLGTTNHLELLWYSTSWHFQDMTSVTGTGNATSGSSILTTYNQIAKTTEVYYLGPQRHLYQLFCNGTWHAQDLTVNIGLPAVNLATAFASDYDSLKTRQEIYYLGTNQHVYQAWYNGTWHYQDLTSITGAPTSAAPADPLP